MAEKVEKDTSATSAVTSALEKECNMTVDQEKGRLTPSEAVAEDSRPDEKNSDLSIEEASKANDDTHSDPETGEFEESSLSSVKEPHIDATENKMVPPVDNVSETDGNLEVSPLNMHCPVRRCSS